MAKVISKEKTEMLETQMNAMNAPLRLLIPVLVPDWYQKESRRPISNIQTKGMEGIEKLSGK